jgi:hypothetical protein
MVERRGGSEISPELVKLSGKKKRCRFLTGNVAESRSDLEATETLGTGDLILYGTKSSSYRLHLYHEAHLSSRTSFPKMHLSTPPAYAL